MLHKGLTAAAGEASDQVASQIVDLYPVLRYDGGLVPVGTRINWEGALMRANRDVWDREDQDPAHAPDCWDKVMYHAGHRVIPEVIAATQAFGMDETGWWPTDGKVYRSLMHGNTFQPGSTPTPVWEEVTNE